MKNKIAAFGKWVEFESINGGFRYSDDDRTLRYVGNCGEACTVTAPDGCAIRFFVRAGSKNMYCIVPVHSDGETDWSYTMQGGDK